MKKSLLEKLLVRMRSVVWLQWLALLVMFPGLVLYSPALQANPKGGTVAHGAVEILENIDNPAFLQILQHSDKAIINWADFSIGAGEHTQFVQPGQMAAVLNRVVSGNPTAIAGLLSANGKVLVVNQNGIVVTPSGVIDAAGGVVLSTLDIADGDFLNGMDDSFLGTTAAGVVNYGTIMSAGGDVVLLGNFVDNQGIIGAPDGVVALGAGGNIVVHAQGENKISVMAPGVGAETGVNNAGTITGAAAELKAHGNVYALAINNSGMIRATGSATIDGRVVLTSRSADGKTGGNIENSGEIEANNADGSGGFVMIDGGPGSHVGIVDGEVSVSGVGDRPGGEMVVIGQTIDIGPKARLSADGSDGGSIIIGSVEDTHSVTIGGTVSANGSSGNGGAVMVVGDSSSVLSVSGTGRIEATGAVNGGMVTMQGGSIHAAAGSVIDAGGGVDGGTVAIIGQDPNGVANMDGTVSAAGGTGAGGVVNVAGAGDVNVGRGAVMNADGATGGLVAVDGAGTTVLGGTVSALGNTGIGGTANVTGANVVVAVNAELDVSGLTGGGEINVGGGFQGRDEELRNSESTVVGGTASLRADAVNSGDAGNVVVWSSGDTIFGGEITARALGEVGRGGFVEVSGKRDLHYNGVINAMSVSGDRGTVLFDPGDMEVGDAASSMPIAGINAILDSNVNVTLATASGDITFESLTGDFRDVSVQWNTDADFGVFASGDVRFLNSVRTAGAGSVSVIAGWTGAEGDPAILANDPEAAWHYYVDGAAAGSFGGGPGGASGNIYINDAANNRSVEVGSRYGTTNVAGNHVFLSGVVGGSGRYAILGFSDNGQVFRVNQNPVHDIDGVGVVAGAPLVGMVGVNETTIGGQVGVRMFNALSPDGLNVDGGGGVHFLEYADDFGGTSSQSNWWWRSLDATAGGSSGIGDNLPEMGAGISDELLAIDTFGGMANAKADINIEARGALIMRAGNSGGSYNSNYAQVGHGGNARDWSNVNLTRETNGERAAYAMNWGSGNSFTTAIGRLAPVYGDINVRTGLVENPLTNVLEPNSASGVVLVQAVSSGNINGRINNNYAMIGHMGVGQGGSATGNIKVEAGGAIGAQSGNGWRSGAIIGHAIDDTDDLRRGKGLVNATGVTPDGRFGGGQHKQFRVFATNANQTSATLGRGDLAGYVLPNLGVGIYDGATQVTGAGADAFSNFEGDILATSATGDVSVKGAIGDPLTPRERIDNSPARIGHGAFASSSEYRLNTMGDITVEASRDILVMAGNGRMSSAQIGHFGGARETTNDYSVGDIIVTAGGDLVLEGGGRTVMSPRNEGGTTTDYQAFAMIGHGGNEADNTFKDGDVTVTVGGNLTMSGGGYGGAFVQIGHGGENSEGQIGGDFTRTIQIADDTSDGARTVDWVTSNVAAMGTDVQLDPNMTANVVVAVTGEIVMDHLVTNDPLVENTDAPGTPASIQMSNSHTLIGHGGANTTSNTGTVINQYWDHTGDVTVTAGGRLMMQSGGGSNNWYTRIGHGATEGDRQSNGREALFSGNVVVDVGGYLTMDANNADSVFGNVVGTSPNGENAYSHFAQANPVAIGNGGTRDSVRVNFEGDVTVTVRDGDATLTSGKGLDASFVQIGNGGSGGWNTSDNADDVGQFTGNVTLDVQAGDLLMQANPDGVAYMIEPTSPYSSTRELHNSYVLIGNGGAQWRTSAEDVATADGDVTVTVSGDVTMLATERKQFPGLDPLDDPRLIGGFVQIGNALSGKNSLGTANGDVYVEVGGDLRMRGGRGEGDPLTSANLGSYAQIGNGGAQMDGGISGNIEVNVGNNLSTEDGDGGNDGYVKIGLGDWMRDNPGFSGSGDRHGDIAVKVGNTASFDHTLVGHRDSATSGGFAVDTGNTFIGVSRANPFFGGPGRLVDSNASGRGGSVFTSGGDGLFGQLRLYMPARSNNGLLQGMTRINSDTVTFVGNEGGANFAMPTQGAVRGTMGEMPGFQREDEIYLQPDWWSDNDGSATVPGGAAFPGGSVANVDSPGGFANLATLGPGVFGDGTANNAHGELTYLTAAQNTLGNYTLYYDAIEGVAPLVPGGGGGDGGGGFVPPKVVPEPVLPPAFFPDLDLFNFLFFNEAGADLFGYTEGDWLILGDVEDSGGDTTEGLGPQQPGWLFGTKNRALTLEEEERERRRRARYHLQVSNGGRVFWVYDVSTREYSSFRLFGTPSSPRP